MTSLSSTQPRVVNRASRARRSRGQTRASARPGLSPASAFFQTQLHLPSAIHLPIHPSTIFLSACPSTTPVRSSTPPPLLPPLLLPSLLPAFPMRHRTPPSLLLLLRRPAPRVRHLIPSLRGTSRVTTSPSPSRLVSIPPTRTALIPSRPTSYAKRSVKEAGELLSIHSTWADVFVILTFTSMLLSRALIRPTLSSAGVSSAVLEGVGSSARSIRVSSASINLTDAVLISHSLPIKLLSSGPCSFPFIQPLLTVALGRPSASDPPSASTTPGRLPCLSVYHSTLTVSHFSKKVPGPSKIRVSPRGLSALSSLMLR